MCRKNITVEKKCHTVKNDVICTASQYIIFASQTYRGKVHDKRILDEEGIKYPENAILLMDTGFIGYNAEGAIVLIPYKKPIGGELTVEQKKENREISRKRVCVENAIGGAKRNRSTKELCRNWKEGIKDTVFIIACSLHNLRVKLRYSTKN